MALQVASDAEAAVVEHVEQKKETTVADCAIVHHYRKLTGAKIEFSRSSLATPGTVRQHMPVRFPEGGRAVQPAVASAGGATMCQCHMAWLAWLMFSMSRCTNLVCRQVLKNQDMKSLPVTRRLARGTPSSRSLLFFCESAQFSKWRTSGLSLH